MGWTTGKDAEAPGKFAYELWSDAEILHRVGGFATLQEADRAGARANTDMLLYGVEAVTPLSGYISGEELDELLAQVLGGAA